MIRAVLLALGLVTGPLQVGVELEPGLDSPPHAVEIYLDGELAAKLSEPPWNAEIDLGDELRPHELVVVSLDRSRNELDRRTRWLNLPESQTRHVGAVDATPVVVLLDDPKHVPEGLDRWFQIDGQPAKVVGLEYPDAELWIVRDPRLMDELEDASALVIAAALEFPGAVALLDGDVLRSGPEATLERLHGGSGFAASDDGHRFLQAWERWQTFLSLDEDTEVRFVSPWGAPVSQVETPRQIFTTSSPVDARRNGVLFHLFNTRPLGRWYRMADAIGIAGFEAAAGQRRRAVLVLTSETDESDLSLYDIESIRGLLDDLGVPLRVWSFEYGRGDSSRYWGPGTYRIQAPLGGAAEPLWAAHRDLSRMLERQRVVWLEGRHLPGRIRLAAEAQGVRLVRDSKGVSRLTGDQP